MVHRQKSIRGLCVIAAWFSICATPSLETVAQDDDSSPEPRIRKIPAKRESKSDDGNRPRPRAVLWVEPLDLERRDLFHGSGGKHGAPDPSDKFRFVRRVTSGTQEKIVVRDRRGREWTVKFGPEAKPEVAATRILWAAGYHVDQDYFVRRAYIEGRGGFAVWDVRFERRDDGLDEVGFWSWDSNPFGTSRELQGLKVLMALLKNWDVKTENNKIARPENGKADKLIYYVADLGATLGATGSFLNEWPFLGDIPASRTLGPDRSRGHPEAFGREAFIKDVRNGVVVFNHERSRGRRMLRGVTVESAAWIGNLLARLSDTQLADAFRAGGFNNAETAIYVQTMRERIRQLQALDDHYPVQARLREKTR